MFKKIKSYLYTHPELVIAAVALVYMLIEFFYQDINTKQGGKGWDGYNHYYMAKDLDYTAIQDPFRYRIFSATFVHFMPHLPFFSNSIIDNYRAFNFVFAFIFLLYVFKLLRLIFPKQECLPAVFFTWFLVVSSEMSPARTLFFLPVNSDIVHETMILLAAYFFIKLRFAQGQDFKDNWQDYFALVLSFFIGGTNRENFYTTIALASFACVYYEPTKSYFMSLKFDKKALLSIAAMCIGVASAMATVSIFLGNFGSQGKIKAILTYLFLYKTVKMLIALINAYGVYFLCMLNTRKTDFGIDKGLFYSCKIAILVTLAVSMVGGSDTERYIYWNIPFIAILTLPYVHTLFSHRRYLKLCTIGLFTIVLHKLFFTIYHNGQGVYHNFRAEYTMWQVFMGKGPVIYNWSGFSHPMMKFKLLLTYGLTVAFVLAQDFILATKNYIVEKLRN